jgi:predicted Zn-dependent protease
MRHTRPVDVGFWIVAVAAITMTTAGIFAQWPYLVQAAHSESITLVNEGRESSGGESQSDYRLATWLNSSNTFAYADLASAQLAAGQPRLALASLSKAGSSKAITPLKVKILMELGRDSAAAEDATALTSVPTTDSNLVLASLAYSLNNQASRINALLPRITSPEALQAADRAQAGKLALATQLYASGLLNSSNAVLQSLPPSYERNIILSRIYYSNPTSTNLQHAQLLLNAAVAYDPSSIDAHRLLSRVYRSQNKTPQADSQTALVSKLQSGRP